MVRRLPGMPTGGRFDPGTRFVVTPLGRAALHAARHPAEPLPALLRHPVDLERRLRALERERESLLALIDQLDGEVGRLRAELAAVNAVDP